MKELFIILLMTFYVTADDECLRVETYSYKIDVDWCPIPITVTLPEKVGYCTNARCRSSHMTHDARENITIGKIQLAAYHHSQFACYHLTYSKL